MNSAIFHWINGWPDALNPVFQLFSEGNKWWIVRILLLGILAAMIIWGKERGRKAALLTILAVPIANELTDVLKAAIPDLRPCVVEPDAILRIKQLTSSGTASAHSANMAAVACVMTYFLRWDGAIWILVALLTGISRIYVAAHYPSQVLAGWIVGILVGLVLVKAYEWIARRYWNRNHEPPEAVVELP